VRCWDTANTQGDELRLRRLPGPAFQWPTALGVEQYAAAGRNIDVPRLGCPGCKELMSYWGWYQRASAGRWLIMTSGVKLFAPGLGPGTRDP
jgi:hypothetical protein